MFIDLLLIFFISFAVLFLMRNVARNIGLVDKPSGRKMHTGNINLVGGTAIFLTIVNLIYTHPVMINHFNLFCESQISYIG